MLSMSVRTQDLEDIVIKLNFETNIIYLLLYKHSQSKIWGPVGRFKHTIIAHNHEINATFYIYIYIYVYIFTIYNSFGLPL
jgi:hypothetical protein